MKYSVLFIFGVISCFACNQINGYRTVSTIAGKGLMGANNGKASEASFSNLMGLTIDSQGNIFVADSRNNLIRKVSSKGIVTTIAGNGNAGSVDGKGETASFFYPEGIAVDKNGYIYIADTHNSLIRKISPEGLVSTLAGQRIYHNIPAKDTTIRFDNPAGIAVDDSGYVYVADCFNNLIRKISPDGKVSNIAGNVNHGAKDGIGSAASFYLPGGITLDSAGNIYISDTYNNMIRKISPSGVVTTLAGNTVRGSLNGNGPAATFSHPAGITIDPKGNIYVADVENNKIRKITPDAVVSVFAGSGMRGSENGRDTTASFYRPYGVVADKSGNIYVADYLNNVIRKIK
jgi:sugar lactone lactonase YvrE